MKIDDLIKLTDAEVEEISGCSAEDILLDGKYGIYVWADFWLELDPSARKEESVNTRYGPYPLDMTQRQTVYYGKKLLIGEHAAVYVDGEGGHKVTRVIPNPAFDDYEPTSETLPKMKMHSPVEVTIDNLLVSREDISKDRKPRKESVKSRGPRNPLYRLADKIYQGHHDHGKPLPDINSLPQEMVDGDAVESEVNIRVRGGVIHYRDDEGNSAKLSKEQFMNGLTRYRRKYL